MWGLAKKLSMKKQNMKEAKMKYEAFVDPETAFANISQHWKKWADESKLSNYVVGISGGVDSTCAAALAAKIFGKSNVIGVSLPCDG